VGAPLRFRSATGLAALLFAVIGAAQMAAAQHGDTKVDARTRNEVIERVLGALDRTYVFPDVAARMRDAVRQRVAKGEYEPLTDAGAFAEKLTADLQAVSRDKHLRVRVAGSGRSMRMMLRAASDGGAEEEDGGFARVEQLPGNVGYVDLRMFHPAHVAGQHAAAAMNRLAESDALIIDLRKNGGGSADMVALLVSYLLEPERILVNTFVGRDGKVLGETWTTPDLPGRRFTGKDVYVLTSSYTFSAAEEFAYDVKNLKRATIVGETTGGGANPIDMFRINDRFEASIPTARAMNPITRTNWEGVGVSPDVSVPAELALETAHLAALRKRHDSAPDEQTRAALRDAISGIEKQLNEKSAARAGA
jgi:retinol-binding protein 3